MKRHPWRRLTAWLIDWLLIVGWVVITAAVGVPLLRSGLTAGLSIGTLNLIATLVLVVPITVGLSWLDSRASGASPGKRARNLVVIAAATGSRISFKQALVRDALKIGVPWIIGHAAVYEIVAVGTAGTPPVAVWILTAVAYVLPVIYIAALFVGSGRTPYDRISGTLVASRMAISIHVEQS